MQIVNQEAYDSFLQGADSFNLKVLAYAERWSSLMEKKIERGESLNFVAESTSHKADLDGLHAISGSMFTMAVGLLSDIWMHGPALLDWYNARFNIKI